MKCVQLVEKRHLEVAEMPMDREPGPGEVMVRIKAVGICGSDLHWYMDGIVGEYRMPLPQVMGHEPAGEIVAVGPGVTTRKVGQRVAIEPAMACYHCEFCHAGKYNLCPNVKFLSAPPLAGCFREFVTVPIANASPIPDSMTMVQATIVEPLAVIMHMLELTPIRMNETVAVMGAGPIGLLTAQGARLAGAGKVFSVDRVAHRARLAKSLGADEGICSREADPVESILDLTGGRGVDVVFDAAADSETLINSLKVLRTGGRLCVVGISYETSPRLDWHLAMNKEINIQTIRRSNHNDDAAIALIAAGKITDGIVSHRFPLDKTADAFKLLEDYSDGVAKVIIEP